MKEFFELDFGKTLQGKVDKVKGTPMYRVTKEIDHPYLTKGDYFYLDRLHKDHIEVFNKHGRINGVLNLDGSKNNAKSFVAFEQNRTIQI